MTRQQLAPKFDASETLKKFFLSGFVVLTFGAYVAHQHLTSPDTAVSLSPSTTGSSAPAANSVQSANTLVAGNLKDGTYTGQEVDAYYGLVKVQATVANGTISNVAFLEWPTDRRTSQRINSYAVPTLQSEAMQAQSANVDLVSGATLTSQAFVASLQTALSAARN